MKTQPITLSKYIVQKSIRDNHPITPQKLLMLLNILRDEKYLMKLDKFIKTGLLHWGYWGGMPISVCLEDPVEIDE